MFPVLLLEVHEVAISQYLKLVHVPLNDIKTLQYISPSPKLRHLDIRKYLVLCSVNKQEPDCLKVSKY